MDILRSGLRRRQLTCPGYASATRGVVQCADFKHRVFNGCDDVCGTESSHVCDLLSPARAAALLGADHHVVEDGHDEERTTNGASNSNSNGCSGRVLFGRCSCHSLCSNVVRQVDRLGRWRRIHGHHDARLGEAADFNLEGRSESGRCLLS